MAIEVWCYLPHFMANILDTHGYILASYICLLEKFQVLETTYTYIYIYTNSYNNLFNYGKN